MVRWMSDMRRETEWERWFAWHAVPVETLSTGSSIIYATEKLKMVKWERIERRKTAVANNQFIYIYRPIGSAWEFVMPERPKPAAPITSGRIK